jgi:lipopolysaccharide exporter
LQTCDGEPTRMRSREDAPDGVAVSAAYTVVTSLVARGLGLVGTLALTRFLTPSDYGAAMLAAVWVGTVTTLTSPGLGQFVVAHPDAPPRLVFHATALHLVLGGVAAALLFLGTGMLPPSLVAPESYGYLPPLLLGALFDRVGYIPGRLLARAKRFRSLGLRTLLGEVLFVAVSVTSALAGSRGAALVHGTVARSVVTTLVLVAACPAHEWLAWSRPSLAAVRKLLAFGVPMSLANSLQWLSRRGDNLLIGGLFGSTVAASYNLAYNLADVPATQLGEPVGDVLLPTFAATSEPSERQRALTRALGLLALVISPLALGLGLVAPTLIEVMLPPRWSGVAALLAPLAALSMARPAGWVAVAYLQARHRPRAVLLLEALKVVLLGLFIVALSPLGPIASCYAIGVAFAVHAVVAVVLVQRGERLRIGDALVAYLRPMLACVPMAPAVWLARFALLDMPSEPRLALEILVGASVWLATTRLTAAAALADALTIVRTRLLPRRDEALSR